MLITWFLLLFVAHVPSGTIHLLYAARMVVGSPGRADGRARARVSRNALGRRGFSADHSRGGGDRPRAWRPARSAAEPAAYDRSARISAGHLRVGNAGRSLAG